MSKTVASIQSNYIPWKGYFDVIARADEFILLDDVQYTRRDWRNRNRIKTANGLTWLTVPVQVKGKYTQRIDETRLVDLAWVPKHLGSLRQAYARSAHFAEVWPGLEAAYQSLVSDDVQLLTDVNERLIRYVMEELGIDTALSRSTDYATSDDRNKRLLDLCVAAGADTYLSGPAAEGYLDVDLFASRGVGVEFMSYHGYPEYPQLHGDFEHGVTVLDLLFNCGAAAPQQMLAAAPSQAGRAR